MTNDQWKTGFREVYERGVAAWKAGRKSPASMFGTADTQFLAGIGCSTQELFDFIDDEQEYGEPDFDTTLAVTALRRDYFLNVMKGQSSGKMASMADLPPKAQAVDGIAWLPRLIVKARLKLRGEMPPDLMYGCGGDRPFVQSVNMTLAEFLQLVWESGNDDRRIIDAVKRSAGRA